MDDQTLLAQIQTWRSMPDYVVDVRDFQLVKTRPYPQEQKAQFFSELYAQMNEEQRRRLPALMGDCPTWVLCDLFLHAGLEERIRLFGHAKGHSLRIDAGEFSIKSKDDIDALCWALARVVLLQGDDDYGDILMTLSTLWLEAVNAGIDPRPYFQAVAQTASTDNPYGRGSTQDMLVNFHKSAVFREQVAPHLPNRFLKLFRRVSRAK